jgi:hypothetical protein
MRYAALPKTARARTAMTSSAKKVLAELTSFVDSRAHELNILPFYYLPEAHLSELAAFPLTSSLEDVMGM